MQRSWTIHEVSDGGVARSIILICLSPVSRHGVDCSIQLALPRKYSSGMVPTYLCGRPECVSGHTFLSPRNILSDVIMYATRFQSTSLVPVEFAIQS